MIRCHCLRTVCFNTYVSFTFFNIAQGCTRPAGSDMNLKDDYILLTEFPDGITVYFACNVGYVTAGGSPKITCVKGNWSALTLKCQSKYHFFDHFLQL